MDTSSQSDHELLTQVYAGEPSAFDALADRHRGYLKNIIDFRLDDRMAARLDASDLVQETFTEAFRRVKREGSPPPLPVRLWLRQIAIDRVKMAERRHLRTQKRSILREMSIPSRSSIMLAKSCLGPTPEDLFSRKELTLAVRQAMGELSDVDQAILSMRTFECLTYDEIGILIEITPATARKRYGRALLRLQARLESLLSSQDS
jgi:RNA polymerase sigma-70 factor (ECF subfamily)